MKRVLACLTAALLVLGITACGGAPEEKQPQDDSQPEKVTITYLKTFRLVLDYFLNLPFQKKPLQRFTGVIRAEFSA